MSASCEDEYKRYPSTQPNNEAEGGEPGLTLEQRMARTMAELVPKLARADEWPEYNSLHEAYGVLAEEFDELFDHVRLRQTKRDSRDVRGEALDVAAVALRIAAVSLIHGWVRK